MTNWNRLVFRYGLPASAVLIGVFVAESTAFSIIALMFAYGLWVGTLKLVGRLSRLASGVVVILLSAFLFVIGFITPWVGAVGLVVFAHGSWRALSGAARLHV